ncbi:MAG: hypothetical protein CSA84_04560 [Actinomycetales bacterium]|nr:MAG: hypothetical protein CSA84_04560 [Actinomycetales bacterium]
MTTLLDQHVGVVCDLDGVVYRGPAPIPHAVASLERAREQASVVFATNNASRTIADVSNQLRSLGIDDPQVITSAGAGAALIVEQLGPEATVLPVGGEGLVEALTRVGLVLVRDASQNPAAVLQGWAPHVSQADLAQATIAVSGGAFWVATNTDLAVPTPAGLVPGNGPLVAAVAAVTGVDPMVAGKPHPPLFRSAVAQIGSQRSEVGADTVLGIGDRLDTDVLGATGAGLPALWVLTGVDRFVQLAGHTATPTYAAPDLNALHRPYPAVSRRDTTWASGPISVTVGAPGDRLTVCGMSELPDDQALATLVAIAARIVCGIRDLGDSELAGRLASEFDAIVDGFASADQDDSASQSSSVS